MPTWPDGVTLVTIRHTPVTTGGRTYRGLVTARASERLFEAAGTTGGDSSILPADASTNIEPDGSWEIQLPAVDAGILPEGAAYWLVEHVTGAEGKGVWVAPMTHHAPGPVGLADVMTAPPAKGGGITIQTGPATDPSMAAIAEDPDSEFRSVLDDAVTPTATTAGAQAAIDTLADQPAVTEAAATRAVTIAADPTVATLLADPGSATGAAFGQKVDLPSGERVLYVTSRGNDAADGLSLKSARRTLGSAVASLTGAGVIQLGYGTITDTEGITPPPGTIIRGAGPAGTAIAYSGAGAFITNPTPGVRVANWRIEDLTITGPGKDTDTVGIDLESVSTSHFENVRVSGFGKAWRIRSAINGGAVYNTFINCNGSTSGVGFSIEASGSNASRFFACRANGCDIGVDITDSNNTTWYGGQLEVNGVAVRVTATAAGASDNNLFAGSRFENNSLDVDIDTPFVRYARITNPLAFGGLTVNDLGTSTMLVGTARTDYTSSAISSARGSWRYTRTSHGGSELPAFVIVDENTSTGTPVTVQIETGRAGGSFLRGRRGGSTYLDMDARGGLFMGNHVTTPSVPSSGGWLYVDGGALKYLGSSGTVTTIAPA